MLTRDLEQASWALLMARVSVMTDGEKASVSEEGGIKVQAKGMSEHAYKRFEASHWGIVDGSCQRNDSERSGRCRWRNCTE